MSDRPFVKVSLDPEFDLLCLELEGVAGQTRTVPLKKGLVEEILFRVLLGLDEARSAGSPTPIGSEGAPTRAQVWHWKKHGETKDTRCAFCRAELAARVSEGLSGAEITKYKLGEKFACETSKSLEDLGL